MKNNLKQIRESQGLEQADVARDLDISLSTYRSWEQGARGLNGEKLVMFAKYFKVTTDTILGSQYSELDKTLSLDNNEKHLVSAYRTLGDDLQHSVLTIVLSLAGEGN